MLGTYGHHVLTIPQVSNFHSQDQPSRTSGRGGHSVQASQARYSDLDWVGTRCEGEDPVTLLAGGRYLDPCHIDLEVFRPLVSLFS